MKIGVISDIHSNYHGLKACVDHGIKEGADRFLFLGDYVSDCGYPQKTMNLLYELKDSYECSFIKGNRSGPQFLNATGRRPRTYLDFLAKSIRVEHLVIKKPGTRLCFPRFSFAFL
jgi:predicted phosphodiesterase